MTWILSRLFPPRLPRFSDGEFEDWRRSQHDRGGFEPWRDGARFGPRTAARVYKPSEKIGA